MTASPERSLNAASFAESLAWQYAAGGGDSRVLLATLAGLVAARDPQLAADCLMALDAALSRRASGETPSRSV
jgi:hypothetical protein